MFNNQSLYLFQGDKDEKEKEETKEEEEAK